jgi:hypothetical protein
MSDAIFVANKASGHLAIGDRKEMDKATWRKPRGIRLTPTTANARTQCQHLGTLETCRRTLKMLLIGEERK